MNTAFAPSVIGEAPRAIVTVDLIGGGSSSSDTATLAVEVLPIV